MRMMITSRRASSILHFADFAGSYHRRDSAYFACAALGRVIFILMPPFLLVAEGCERSCAGMAARRAVEDYLMRVRSLTAAYTPPDFSARLFFSYAAAGRRGMRA